MECFLTTEGCGIYSTVSRKGKNRCISSLTITLDPIPGNTAPRGNYHIELNGGPLIINAKGIIRN